jgi:hypothetical protein
MAEFIVEPVLQRIAIATSPKVACTSLRHWLFEIAHHQKFSGGSIFDYFKQHTYSVGRLPKSVQVTIAVHRDGVSRLRAVYDHRIKANKEGHDRGLDHFARYLPEYVAANASLAHHACPQSRWLGSQQSVFSHIIPLNHLSNIHAIVTSITNAETPPLPIKHRTENKTPISPIARKYFEAWSEYDRLLGWDGQ